MKQRQKHRVHTQNITTIPTRWIRYRRILGELFIHKLSNIWYVDKFSLDINLLNSIIKIFITMFNLCLCINISLTKIDVQFQFKIETCRCRFVNIKNTLDNKNYSETRKLKNKTNYVSSNTKARYLRWIGRMTNPHSWKKEIISNERTNKQMSEQKLHQQQQNFLLFFSTSKDNSTHYRRSYLYELLYVLNGAALVQS